MWGGGWSPFLPRRPKTQSETSIRRRGQLFCSTFGKRWCTLPSDGKGYIMTRDAKISVSSWDTVQNWAKTSYTLEDMTRALRRPERPVPGHGRRATQHIRELSRRRVQKDTQISLSGLPKTSTRKANTHNGFAVSAEVERKKLKRTTTTWDNRCG